MICALQLQFLIKEMCDFARQQNPYSKFIGGLPLNHVSIPVICTIIKITYWVSY